MSAQADVSVFTFGCPDAEKVRLEARVSATGNGFAVNAVDAGSTHASALATRLTAILPTMEAAPPPVHRFPWTAQLSRRLVAMIALVLIWLLATGTFGWSPWERMDRVVFVPLAAALFIRLWIVPPRMSELSGFFPVGTFSGDWSDKYSHVYGGMKAVLVAVAGPSHLLLTRLNGLMAAMVVVPLFLFAKRRLESTEAALVAATLYAVHPLLAHSGPTDAPYPALLFFWFGGLALLARASPTAGSLCAGALCLGIAGTFRPEAPALAALAAFLVPWRPIFAAIRAERRIAVGAGLGFLGGAVVSLGHFAVLSMEGHNAALGGYLQHFRSSLSLSSTTFVATEDSDPIALVLFCLGLLAPLTRPALRPTWLVAGASVLATLLVATPVANAITVHRLFPAYALQTVVRGVGAAWVAGLFRQRQQSVVLAFSAALCVFIPLRSFDSLTTEYPFNVEYALLRQHLAAAQGCTLLWFDRGDEGIGNPWNIVPELEFMNCAQEDCMGRAQRPGCTYLLVGTGCYGGAETRAGRETRTEQCMALLRSAAWTPIARKPVALSAAFRVPTDPPSPFGVLGLYRLASH